MKTHAAALGVQGRCLPEWNRQKPATGQQPRNPAFSTDYMLFSEVLMQRPVRLGQLWGSHLISREEAAYMQEMAREHFDGIMEVLKALPRPMLLVLRNINTVRAINSSLGTPVDRYFLMAKRLVTQGEARRRFSRLAG